MLGQQALRRDMSYRKPVPKYIPSPPPSPRSPSTNNRQSLSMESIMYHEMPPLPSGWRDAIDRATSNDKRKFTGTRTDVDGSGGSRPPSSRSACWRERASPSMNDRFDNYSMSDLSDETLAAPLTSPIPWVQSPRASRKRTLPLDYRPPTPPLPAYAKQGRLSDEASTVAFPSIDYHMIYPDPPSIIDLNSIIPRATFDEKPERLDLPPGTSFQSETTGSSSMTRRSSFSARVDAPSTNSRETWLRETWCIIPMLPVHGTVLRDSHSTEEKRLPSLGASNQIRRLWEHLAMLGHSLRARLRTFRAAPFPNCVSV